MEAEKTLTNEEIIRELLDLLKKNTMKEQANDVFEHHSPILFFSHANPYLNNPILTIILNIWCS